MLALYHNDMSLCAQKVRVCLAEKGLPWEDRHLVLRDGPHQQDWYKQAQPPRGGADPDRRRQGDPGIERHPGISRRRLSGAAAVAGDSYGRAQMRLWTRQLDEDIHDASAASSASASRSVTSISNAASSAMRCSSRSRTCSSASAAATWSRRGRTRSISSSRSSAWSSSSTRWKRRWADIAWLVGDEYTLADVAFTPYLLRLEHLDLLGMVDGTIRGSPIGTPAARRGRALPRRCANGRTRNISR